MSLSTMAVLWLHSNMNPRNVMLVVPGVRSTILRRCGAYTTMVAGSASRGGMTYSVHVRVSRYHSPGASNSSRMPRT